MEYTDLEVWKEARSLVNQVYNLIKKFPNEELYSLSNQIKRCSVSVPSNIAEGCGRRSAKETIQFLFISRGSLYELETQFYLALDQNFIDKSDFKDIIGQIALCKRLLSGFINYYKTLSNGK